MAASAADVCFRELNGRGSEGACAAAADADGDPRDVFEMIEEDLRARLAVPIEANGSLVSTTRQIWKEFD
jgi:hypothetical protein